MNNEAPQPGQEPQVYTKAQTWAALRKCWKAYRIAKVRADKPNMLKYAERIRKLQGELNVTVSEFPDLGLVTEA
jgi:hypothetical protein